MADATQKARYLASMALHSGDWLLALPITSCGLRLDDEAVRVAVGATVERRWMPRLATLLCAKRPLAEWPDIRL